MLYIRYVLTISKISDIFENIAIFSNLLRIFKMIAISGFLTASKCTKFVFCWGSASEMTYIVSGGALNSTHSLTPHL